MDYSKGRSILFFSDGDHQTSSFYPQSGRADMNSDIEMFILETITANAVIRIGSYLFKPIISKSGKYILKLVGLADNAANKGTKAILSSSETLRIENAASRISKTINVVGSRASGTAKLTSDWDYVIQGLTNKEWKMIKNYLPDAPSRIDGLSRNIDMFKETLDISKPYIPILPK